MSELAALQFLSSAASNPGLSHQLTVASEGRSPAEAYEAVAALGAAAGFTFSGAEALAMRDRFLALASSEAGAEENGMLDGVRGGAGAGSSLMGPVGAPSGMGSIEPSMTLLVQTGYFTSLDTGPTPPTLTPNPPTFDPALMADLQKQIQDALDTINAMQNSMAGAINSASGG